MNSDLVQPNKIVTSVADISIREDGIMHIHIKIDLSFEIEHSIELVKARTKLAGGKSYPILYTATKFVIPTQEVREFVASKNRSKLVLADAFVINTLPQRIMAKFYKKMNKPVKPTRVFTNKSKAVDWLKQFTITNANNELSL